MARQRLRSRLFVVFPAPVMTNSCLALNAIDWEVAISREKEGA